MIKAKQEDGYRLRVNGESFENTAKPEWLAGAERFSGVNCVGWISLRELRSTLALFLGSPRSRFLSNGIAPAERRILRRKLQCIWMLPSTPARL